MKKFLIATTALFFVAAPAFAGMSKDDPEMMKKMNEYMWNETDMNHDGKISMEEHKMMTEKCWKESDANNDGSVSQNEFMNAMKMKHDMMMNNMKNTNETRMPKDR